MVPHPHRSGSNQAREKERAKHVLAHLYESLDWDTMAFLQVILDPVAAAEDIRLGHGQSPKPRTWSWQLFWHSHCWLLFKPNFK